jgi:hypothetical protein
MEINDIKSIYNTYTNVSTSFSSEITKFNKPQIDPTNKNFNYHTDFERFDIFTLNIYYSFINYFISDFIITGTEDLDFDGQDLIYKVLNGSCGLYKFRGKIIPVNVSILK